MSKNNENSAQLKKSASELGFTLFGIADLRPIKDEINLPGATKSAFDWGISLGKRLVDGVLEDIDDRPTALYFHHYRQVNSFLDRGALLLASSIQDLGYDSLPIAASQIIDWEKQRGHLSHKKIGLLAGLGWIGRNNLLVNPRLGARFRLVTVLTNMPLEGSAPLEFGCESCRRCLATCPAKAIKMKPEDFDHIACYEKLKEFRRSGIVSQFICGVCVKACSAPPRPRLIVDNPFQIDI